MHTAECANIALHHVDAEGSPAKLVMNAAGEAQDITPSDGVPTVFMARDQPSPHHLVRCRLPPQLASQSSVHSLREFARL